jgi:hypothetical protein
MLVTLPAATPLPRLSYPLGGASYAAHASTEIAVTSGSRQMDDLRACMDLASYDSRKDRIFEVRQDDRHWVPITEQS